MNEIFLKYTYNLVYLRYLHNRGAINSFKLLIIKFKITKYNFADVKSLQYGYT